MWNRVAPLFTAGRPTAYLALALCALMGLPARAQQAPAPRAATPAAGSSAAGRPLEVVGRVADYVVANARFEYILQAPSLPRTFDFITRVDFGPRPATGSVGYAYTVIVSDRDATIDFGIAYGGQIKLYLSGEEVFTGRPLRDSTLRQGERDITLPASVRLTLRRGANPLMIKNAIDGQGRGRWAVSLQPAGATVEFSPVKGFVLDLAAGRGVSGELANQTHWLTLGPVPVAGGRRAIDQLHGPETQLKMAGHIYQIWGKAYTWHPAPPPALAAVPIMSPLWGGYANFNYHTAGLAWAIGALGERNGSKTHKDYPTRYCDFMIASLPLVRYQVDTLGAFRSSQHHLVNTPLLDFTAAPALPFAWLAARTPAERASPYRAWTQRTVRYLDTGQVRLPDGTFTRETPEPYTTWVDDMFMGIPFLVTAAQIAPTPAERTRLLDEAARQTLGFYDNVYNPRERLFSHARYSKRPGVKLPHWSRANGWGIFATTMVLEALPANHKARPAILKRFREHATRIASLQDKQTGFWHQIIDDPSSYRETSATAIFTMALARGVREGWLPARYADQARAGWQALLTQIEDNGVVHGICIGTMSSEDPEYYRTRPVADGDSHGLIGLIWAGIEMDRLEAQPGATTRSR